MNETANTLKIANQIIELAKKLKEEDTMSPAGPFQAPPPMGGKTKRKKCIQELVKKRLAKIGK